MAATRTTTKKPARELAGAGRAVTRDQEITMSTPMLQDATDKHDSIEPVEHVDTTLYTQVSAALEGACDQADAENPASFDEWRTRVHELLNLALRKLGEIEDIIDRAEDEDLDEAAVEERRMELFAMAAQAVEVQKVLDARQRAGAQ